MSNEKNTPPDKKKCPYCSHIQPKEAVFCQKCGVSFTPTGQKSQWRQVKKRNSQQNMPEVTSFKKIPRTCPNCKVVIESTVLEQCPLCLHELPPLPPVQKEHLDRMLFTGKKIVSEKDIRIDRNKWTSGKEIFNTFLNSSLLFVFVTLGGSIFALQGIISDLMLSLIFILGAATLGIFPLIYVAINHLNWTKIGFYPERIVIYILIGAFSGIGLYFALFGIEYLLSFIPTSTPILAFFFEGADLNLTEIGIPLQLVFYGAFLLSQVFEEFLFRGVIHRGIFDRLTTKKKSGARFLSVLLTTLIYSLFYLLLGLSGYGLIINVFLSLLVGIVFELTNRSLTSIISMKIIYVGISTLLFFIPLF